MYKSLFIFLSFLITPSFHWAQNCSMDTEAPVANCQEIIVNIDSTQMGTLNPNDYLHFFTDNCGIDSIWADGPASFSCSDLDSSYQVTLTVKDSAGNMAGCTEDVVLETHQYDTVLFQTMLTSTSLFNLSTGQSQVFHPGLFHGEIQFNPINNNVYLAVGGSILNFDIDGNFLDTIYANSPARPLHDFTLDEVNGHLYFIDFAVDSIFRVNIDGSNITPISTLKIYGLSGGNYSIAIAKDISKLYWSSNVGNSIVRSDLNGGNYEVVVDSLTDPGSPGGLGIDDTSGKVYWTAGSIRRIRKANLDGTNIETLTSTTDVELDIALDLENNRIIASDQATTFELDTTGAFVQNLGSYGLYLEIGLKQRDRRCNQPPVASCSDTTFYIFDSCAFQINPSAYGNQSSDPDGDNLSFSISPVGPFSPGEHTVTLAVDDGLLSDTCTALVTILDTIPPVLSCTNDTVYVNGDESITIDPGSLVLSFTDNCPIILDSLAASMTTFDTSHLGVNTIVLTGFDSLGNFDACLADVTVSLGAPNSPPNAICDTVYVYAQNHCDGNLQSFELGTNSTDPDGDSLSFTHSPLGPYCLGTHLVTLYVSDGEYQDSCQTLINVLDTVPPAANCSTIFVTIDSTGTGILDPTDYLHFFTDNHGVDSIWVDAGRSSYSCADLDSMLDVRLAARDSMGNQSNCVVDVVVIGNIYEDGVLYSSNSGLEFLNIESGQIDTVFESNSINGIEVDNRNQLLYVNTGNHILKLDWDGAVLDTVYMNETHLLYHVELDSISSLLNFHIGLPDSFYQVNVDGSSVSGIERGFGLPPNGMSLDLINNYLYYACCFGQISRHSLSGGNKETIITESDPIGSIQVDPESFRLYWAQGAFAPNYAIRKSDLDGISNGIVVDSLNNLVRSLALDHTLQKIYWIDNQYLFVTDTLGSYIDTLAEISGKQIRLAKRLIPNNCNQPPIASCNDTTVYLQDSCSTMPTELLLASATSDPDDDPLQFTFDPPGPFGPGMHQIKVLVSDGSLIDSCTSTLNILDTTPPTFICLDTILGLDGNPTLSFDPLILVENLNDNCYFSLDSVFPDMVSYDTSDIGENLLEIFAYDSLGNEGSCQSNVTIRKFTNNQPPVPICDTLILHASSPCEANIDSSAQLGTNSFDPDGEPLTYFHHPTGPYSLGDHQVTLLVGDGELFDSCQALIRVLDTLPPVLTCQDTILQLDSATLTLDITAIDLLSTAISISENCQVTLDSFTISQNYFDCNDIGSDTLTVALTDLSGNTGYCSLPYTIVAPDSDNDGTDNCSDECPDNPNLSVEGNCGCTTNPIDSDNDGTPDCEDECPNDPLKTLQGQCGCSFPDADSDGDGISNCLDFCPNDSLKIFSGECGCGVADADNDGDGVLNCLDGCPEDSLKVSPGTNGCGVMDPTPPDTDNDGTPDVDDDCPFDPNKTSPGTCGCGNDDNSPDSDNDGLADCLDACPTDPNKITPGACGCGVLDIDTDGDGAADCIDMCPNDPLKVVPGACGCGTSNDDTDGDGILDCDDGCPTDPLKIAAGTTGCGNVDPVPPDTDGDGIIDTNDLCPLDANKTSPGICGCGTIDSAVDSDGDGIRDCLDGCPQNPLKSSPNGSGCFSPCSDFNVMLSQSVTQNTVEISSTWINASGMLMADTVYMQAGNFMDFNSGFFVDAGSNFTANIDACVGGISMPSMRLVPSQNIHSSLTEQTVASWDKNGCARLSVPIEKASNINIEFINYEKGTSGYLLYNKKVDAGQLEILLRNNANVVSPFKIIVTLDGIALQPSYINSLLRTAQ